MDNVLEWISDHVESNKIDAHSLSLALCSVDGYSLCQMAQDQMIEVFGPQLGSHLYQSLQEHKTKYGNPSAECVHLYEENNQLSTNMSDIIQCKKGNLAILMPHY